MKKHKPPNRQPRGPHATLPKAAPGPPCGMNPWPIGDAWWAHNNEQCACWHLYDECPCLLDDHVAAHLAAGCPCS